MIKSSDQVHFLHFLQSAHHLKQSSASLHNWIHFVSSIVFMFVPCKDWMLPLEAVAFLFYFFSLFHSSSGSANSATFKASAGESQNQNKTKHWKLTVKSMTSWSGYECMEYSCLLSQASYPAALEERQAQHPFEGCRAGSGLSQLASVIFARGIATGRHYNES